jgi:hypothetical protein
VKLNLVQLSWMIAAGVFFIAALLDVTGVLQVPHTLLIVVPILLFVLSWAVGPSLKEITKANRSG